MKDQSRVRKENAIRPDKEGNQISIDYFIHKFTRRGQIELKTLPNSVLYEGINRSLMAKNINISQPWIY